MGQLADAKARLAQANTEEEQSRQKLAMNQKDLKALEARWKEVEREASEGQKRLQAMRAEVQAFKNNVAQSGWSAEKDQEDEVARRNAKAEVRLLTEVCLLASRSSRP